MSYPGNSPPGNGSWAQAPPYYYPHQHNSQRLPPQPPPPQPVPRNHQYSNVNMSSNTQNWNPNTQLPYPRDSARSNPAHQTHPTNSQTAPHLPPPHVQYISPAQLFQQPPPQSTQPPQNPRQQQQSSYQGQRLPAPSGYKSSARMVAPNTESSAGDMPMLLVSLAEEYFIAARKLAPNVAHEMTDGGVGNYNTLIATGLGCLDTALKRVRLPPRLEASVRLRYAGILFEETENYMEAETTLSKGISLCERNHYYDLKYAMQFLLAQIMAKKNRKASMKTLDGHIADAQAYQHLPWVYAFRFLRASYALESDHSSDSYSAIQNLQAIADLANRHNDYAIHLLASVMEAYAHLKSATPESLEHVQTAIAAARSLQMDASCNIPQLVHLTHILDLVCAMKEGNSIEILSKLKAMQLVMDDALGDNAWAVADETITIPIRRTPKSSHVVSQDTRTILGIGNDGGDNLMVSFLSKKDTYLITYLLSGIVLIHKHDSKESTADQRGHQDNRPGLKFLQAGLESLEAQNRTPRLSAGLSDLLSKRQWRGQISCYFRFYMAFCWAGIGDWINTKQCIDALETSAQTFEGCLSSPFDSLLLFLKGVYYQGSGDLDAALRVFQDPQLKPAPTKNSNLSSAQQVERDVGILAGLSTVWILREPRRQDAMRTAALMEELKPLCAKHPSNDIQTAFSLTVASCKPEPPATGIQLKNYLRLAVHGAQKTSNTHFLCITLSIMFSRFFSGVVGDQAIKSAQAAVVQAGKTQNVLLKSVTHGLLGKCYEVQGMRAEAQYALELAQGFAQKARPE